MMIIGLFIPMILMLVIIASVLVYYLLLNKKNQSCQLSNLVIEDNQCHHRFYTFITTISIIFFISVSCCTYYLTGNSEKYLVAYQKYDQFMTYVNRQSWHDMENFLARSDINQLLLTLRIAVYHHPDNEHYWFLFGKIALLSGNIPLTKYLSQRIKTLFPYNINARFNYLEILCSLDNKDDLFAIKSEIEWALNSTIDKQQKQLLSTCLMTLKDKNTRD